MNRWISLGAIVVFLVAATSNGLLVGLAHDEGVSVDIAVGSIDKELVAPLQPVPVSALYSCIDGSAPRSLGDVLDKLSQRVNPYPPGYFLLLRSWTRIAGVHRVSLRLPSMISGVLTLIGLALLAKRLTVRPSAALWVILLAGLSPWFTSMATFARPYSLTLAIGIWSTLCAIDLADGRDRAWRRVLFVVLSLFGLYSLYHYGFVIVWQFSFLTLAALRSPREKRGPALGAIVLMGLVICAAFTPWLPALERHLELTGNTPSYYKGAILESSPGAGAQLFTAFLFGDAVPRDLVPIFRNAFYGLGGLTLLALVVFLARSFKARGDDITAQALIWTAPLYPGAILLADLAHGTQTLTITKTCFLLFPMMIVAMVHAWCSIDQRRLRQGGLVCWALLLACATATSAHARTLWVDHHAAVAKALAASDTEGHHILLNSMIRGHAIPLLLTLEESGVENLQVVYAPPLQLQNTLRRTLRDEDSEHVTLVNLHALYAWDETQLWSQKQIEASARSARRAGWNVHHSPPAAVARRIEPAPAPRRFEIINPVW